MTDPDDVDDMCVVAAGVMFMLFGQTFVVLAIRPHPDSEAGSLTGGSALAAQAMGIGTGVWLILTALALFAGGLTRLGGVQPRDPDFGPQRPRPQTLPRDSVHYRYFRQGRPPGRAVHYGARLVGIAVCEWQAYGCQLRLRPFR